MAIRSKLGIHATKKLPAKVFKRPSPPLIELDEAVKAMVNALFANTSDNPRTRA
jgi:3-polyprenyl-4-hydroxybenzoate decarboxylase